MRAMLLETTDPAVNLATEEWLLKNAATDVFMLWRNAPAVIVGRNQNTRAQIDEAFVRERGIPLNIRNTNLLDHPGTLMTQNNRVANFGVTLS